MLRKIPILIALMAPAFANDLNGPLTEAFAMRVLIDPRPVTLDPFRSIDASGQKITALIFRALTKINTDLEVTPDLAASIKTSADGRALSFTWPNPAPTDETGQPITPTDMQHCVENYLHPQSLSPHRAAFTTWKAAQATPHELRLTFSAPDPYATRNLSLLRFFRTKGQSTPCAAPRPGDRLIASGNYAPESDTAYLNPPQSELTLRPRAPQENTFEFHFISDETAKIAALLRGQVDVVFSALGISKTRWLERTHGNTFAFFNRRGVALQYLAFNLKDPRLSDVRVRQALAHALNRDLLLRTRLKNYADRIETLLPPIVPEAAHFEPLAYDPTLSRELLAQAGYGAQHPLSLEYRTTPSREGIELGQILQEQWRKIGVTLRLEVVEPAVFLRTLQQGTAAIYSSRWVGISDASILLRTLRSGQKLNRVGFTDIEVDQWLDQAMSTTDARLRTELLRKVQVRAREQMPYFPLWTWTQTLIVRKSRYPHATAQNTIPLLSLSGALETVVRVGKHERAENLPSPR